MYIVFFLFLVFPKIAFAYLDPGTGSYIVQIFLASFFLVSFTFKTFWRRVFFRLGRIRLWRNFLRRLLGHEKNEGE